MTSRPTLWLLWIGAATSYAVLILWAGAQLIDAAGGGYPFDLRPFGVTQSVAQEYLSGLGMAGRAIYARIVMPVDTIFPVLMTLALVLTTRRIVGRFGWAILPAILYLLAELAENQIIFGLMSAGPDAATASLVQTLQWITRAKFAAFFVACGVVLVQWRKG
jgi:hypothetical protein